MESDGQAVTQAAPTDGQNPQPQETAVPEVAITGSPNTVTDISFDVRSTHLQTPLLGTLLSFRAPVQSQNKVDELIVLGQVATITTENRWHEDASLKNYIKLHGRLPHLTEIGDITTGTIQVIGAYRKVEKDGARVYDKTRLPVPPGSGIAIQQVDRDVILDIMSRDFGYAYLGNFYGSSSVPAPVYVRHFGDFGDRGTGEAYMGGVFGPSGSGKSVIAATLLALWAHSPQMGILILDPQGEFSDNTFARGTGFEFDFHGMLQRTSGGRFRPDAHIVGLDQLQLEGAEIFVEVLREKGFFGTLGVGDAKVSEAAENITRFLAGLDDLNLWNAQLDWDAVNALQITPPAQGRGAAQAAPPPARAFSDLFIDQVANAYAASGRNQRIQDYRNVWQQQYQGLQRVWNETVQLFSPTDSAGRARTNLTDTLNATIFNGAIRILDLNPGQIQMGQHFKLYLMDFVFRRLRQISHINARRNRLGNCLIVLDEAGRYIPQDPGDDDMARSLTKKLTDSVKEMRKLRCGFMFITQTITEIQKEIFRQLHFRVYGVGLGVGADADHMKAREGEDAFELYRALPDPRLSKTFSFMVAGVLLALGSTGRPMVIEGFSSGQAVLDANAHLLASIQQPSLLGLGQPPTQ